MRLNCLLAVLSVASLGLVRPALAQFGEKWHTTPPAQYHVVDITDLDGNGALEFLTYESESPSGSFIALRSTATGALLAQTSSRYEHLDMFTIDLDADGKREILFRDNRTSHMRCFPYAGPPGPLAQRWALRPAFGDPYTIYFADLDGNGNLYVIFQGSGLELEIYSNMGVLFDSHIVTPPFSWSFDYSLVQDFDADGRDEILYVFRDSGTNDQHLIMLESTVPVGVEPRPEGLRAVELGASFPNPASAKTRINYTMPMRGRASLRLLDVLGREVRVLVDGEVAAGQHQAIWDGRDARGRAMPAGTYFYELTAAGQKLGRQVVRLQ